MTRALFLAHTAAPSGAEIALHRLVRAMDKTDVTVVFHVESLQIQSVLRPFVYRGKPFAIEADINSCYIWLS